MSVLQLSIYKDGSAHTCAAKGAWQTEEPHDGVEYAESALRSELNVTVKV